MKTRFSIGALVAIAIMMGLTSCVSTPETDEDPFDDAYLIGHWVDSSVHEKYLANGMGTTWDTADDVLEEEADTFSWSRDHSQLIQEHQMISGVVPRILTINKLDADSLVYEDIGGGIHRFNRCDKNP